MEAMRIVHANMLPERDIDEYVIFCYFAPCTCTEINEMSGILCTRCNEACGFEKDIEKQLVANAISCLCRM